MNLFDLITPGGRKRAKRRERRHAFRDAENAIDTVKERQKELEKESKKQWEAAREATKNGEKAAAQRALVSYRASQTLILKLEQKRWLFEQYYTKMQVAGSDAQFADALGALNKVVDIDPEKVMDVFDTAGDLLGEQADSDRFWEKMYNKEAEGATTAAEDRIPSMEDLGAQLEQEVAAELGTAPAPAAAASEIDSRIAAGQERVRSMLEGR